MHGNPLRSGTSRAPSTRISPAFNRTRSPRPGHLRRDGAATIDLPEPRGFPHCFSMRIVDSPKKMQRLALKLKRDGLAIGFVPTMGYLHQGHVSLMHRARQVVGKEGVVVVSIFVNPTQFAPHEDLSKYPRDFERDQKLCRGAGVDYIFHPTDQEIYFRNDPAPFSTYVDETSLSKRMEGITRPTHFRGVATIVAKLFNLVQPDLAVFGSKDFQQAAIIQRMVRDLDFPVRIIVSPTVREADGLAMSSRNKYLSKDERSQAVLLWNMIQHSINRVSKGPIERSKLLQELEEMARSRPAAGIDYIDFFDPKTLEPANSVSRGSQIALAVYIGKTRLIDNARL
jgi:pantoate--beta-alanine ligase